ncbi:MAG: sensor histidine kinase [Cytophagales bacterium]
MVFNPIVNFILNNRMLRHFLFWFSYAVFNIMQTGILEEIDLLFETQVFLCLLPIKMLFTYIVLHFFFTQFILKGRIFAYLLSIMAIMPFAILAQRAAAHYLIYPYYHPESVAKGLFCQPCLIYGFFSFFFIIGYATSLNVFKHWYFDQQAAQKLYKEKLEAELKFLKAQIHPHFLFNTLNNLYALTLKKSDLAPEMVLKLSDLLNYMLYECNAEKVNLQKEIALIENYLNIEKMRYGFNLKVEFIKQGNFESTKIVPMLILPFIENAFKHGLSDQIENCFVKISAIVEGDFFEFRVENSKNKYSKNQSDPQKYKEGIGLKNVKRRLELQYKNRYELQIDETDSIFVINMRLRIEESSSEKSVDQQFTLSEI